MKRYTILGIVLGLFVCLTSYPIADSLEIAILTSLVNGLVVFTIIAMLGKVIELLEELVKAKKALLPKTEKLKPNPTATK